MLCLNVAYPGDLLLHLESFVTLLRRTSGGARGAFELAARDLAVDRSVLRRRMQTLTSWLRVPILEGRGSRLTPTAAGRRLAERAAVLLATTGSLAEDVARARTRISIGCTGTVTTELLPRVLLDLERRPRPILLAVRRAGGPACERLVLSHELDLGVVRSDAPPAALASRHLADDRLFVVLASSHPLAAARSRPSLAQLARVPLVLYGESSRTRARVMDRLGPRGGVIRAEVDGKASAIAYARAGLGAAFVSLLPGHAMTTPGVWACDVTALFGRSRFYVIGRREDWGDGVVSEVVRRLVHHARRKPA
jgi:LysR family transcriptional regulator, hydrogen peroxide-inducible genes activator